MKILKIVIIALVTVFTFSAAKAQVRVHATVGTRQVHHRTVVVRRPVYHRTVVVHRSWHRRPVYRHHRRY
ncbi:hypothetical protein [Mucilaginibacter boryungensis]|uniref:YXWGXW repeat-containing protein n=1 Tax=Mucilaginibacter boryungensis TaxID=768480 RepID=A0ABR9XEY0_9SPHI|nr:hypothetical protein [Mucilaginibacter boryungensis]MBE9665939.1 hypothetical protein [Mucilaginibacter boryungensis]